MGAAGSVNKVFWSELDIALHETALDLLGPEAELESPWLDGYTFSLSGPIYAGTNEVQRNIVAERILGLPREVRDVRFELDEDQRDFAASLDRLLAGADTAQGGPRLGRRRPRARAQALGPAGRAWASPCWPPRRRPGRGLPSPSRRWAGTRCPAPGSSRRRTSRGTGPRGRGHRDGRGAPARAATPWTPTSPTRSTSATRSRHRRRADARARSTAPGASSTGRRRGRRGTPPSTWRCWPSRPSCSGSASGCWPTRSPT